MEVTKLAPGLWRWTAPHPAWTPAQHRTGGWPRDVGSVYCELGGAVVLVDPLAPPAGSPEATKFWTALDADVRRVGGAVDVLLGNRYHGRSAAEVHGRYSQERRCTIWAHREAAPGLTVKPLRSYEIGEPLPGGVEAFLVEGLPPGEVVYYVPEHRAAIFADALLGADGGKVRVPPRRWAAEDEEAGARYHAKLRPSLRKLLERSLESLLVSHGEIVLHDAERALAEALEAPAWGEE